MHYCVYVIHEESDYVDDMMAKYDSNISSHERVCRGSELVRKFRLEHPEEYKKGAKQRKQALNAALEYYGFTADDQGIVIAETPNPEGHWDWYEKGGRWSGVIPDNEAKLKDLDVSKLAIPYAYVTPDGKWVSHSMMPDTPEGDLAWHKKFQTYLAEKKRENENLVLTQIDCHN